MITLYYSDILMRLVIVVIVELKETQVELIKNGKHGVLRMCL